jgi:release factor glutamine methyltransferase
MTASARTSEGPWTTRRLLTWTQSHFARKGLDNPRVSAEMLLAHVLGTQRIKLYMDLDRPATELERAAFRELVERAAAHEPVDYLVGHASFFSMIFKVTPAVLVPRPSTETVVEHVIQHARRTPGFSSPLIADLGTGSGAIAVALAKHLPNCRVIATDVSADALAIARENAATHAVSDRIDFRQGDLFEPIADLKQRVRYLVSNPPYISDDEWRDVPANVKNYEPQGALRGGVDGLKLLRPLIAHGHEYLDHPGQLVLEIAASQNKTVLQLAEQSGGLRHAHILADHESLPRVLVADRV